MGHPLDRPVWSSLTGPQAPLALVRHGARRYAPEYAMFAALDDAGRETLAGLGALVRGHGEVALVEPAAPPPAPGTRVVSTALCWQMIAGGAMPAPEPTFEITELDEADASEMLALATLTRPGPYFRLTHRLGDFVGVKREGRLVAMAGERMRPHGFTEVSGVCTHPDHRSRGYGAALLSLVASRVCERGEVPFLHVYADNRGAIALYEQLGFAFRQELVMTVLAAA